MMLMFVGYTLIEAAQTRKKNRNFTVQKNMIVISLSLVIFFVIGYAFAYGSSTVGVIGAQANYVGVF